MADDIAEAPEIPDDEEMRQVACTILVLDCPPGFHFGLDYLFWTVGPRFSGVRGIPPGPHFFYYAQGQAGSMGAEYAERLGRFVHLDPAEVIVLRYNEDTEQLSFLEPGEAGRLADGVRRHEFDKQLGPYPMEKHKDWVELTQFISPLVVAKIEPVNSVVISRTQGPAQDDELPDEDGVKAPKPAAASQKDQDAGINIEPNTTLSFSTIPKGRSRHKAVGAELTKAHFDKSEALGELLANEHGGRENDLLGELQFAFICFLLAYNIEAFIQWKNLVMMLCASEDATRARPQLFADLLRVLHAQLLQAPEDFLGGAVGAEEGTLGEALQASFLCSCLPDLIEICEDETLPKKVFKRARFLRELLEQRFKMTLVEFAQLREDGPVVVETEDGPMIVMDDDEDAPMIVDE